MTPKREEIDMALNDFKPEDVPRALDCDDFMPVNMVCKWMGFWQEDTL